MWSGNWLRFNICNTERKNSYKYESHDYNTRRIGSVLRKYYINKEVKSEMCQERTIQNVNWEITLTGWRTLVSKINTFFSPCALLSFSNTKLWQFRARARKKKWEPNIKHGTAFFMWNKSRMTNASRMKKVSLKVWGSSKFNIFAPKCQSYFLLYYYDESMIKVYWLWVTWECRDTKTGWSRVLSYSSLARKCAKKLWIKETCYLIKGSFSIGVGERKKKRTYYQ